VVISQLPLGIGGYSDIGIQHEQVLVRAVESQLNGAIAVSFNINRKPQGGLVIPSDELVIPEFKGIAHIPQIDW
jgi:hypothetical protein